MHDEEERTTIIEENTRVCSCSMPFSSTDNCDHLHQNKPVIRQARVSDLAEITATIVSSFYDYSGFFSLFQPIVQFSIGEDLRYRLQHSSPQYRCLVAIASDGNSTDEIVPKISLEDRASQNRDEIAGTIEISFKTSFWAPRPNYPYIANLAVKHSHRRRGIAKQLLRECEQIALDWGYNKIQLHVLAHNFTAKKLYLDCGYRVIAQEPYWNGFFKPISNRLLLQKNI